MNALPYTRRHLLIVAVACGVGGAWAQQPAPSASGATPVMTTPELSASGVPDVAQGDRAFVQKAAEGGLLEVELGRLAESQAAHSDVKSFGTRMVKDHDAANNKLKTIADEFALVAPTTLDKKHDKVRADMAKLSGDAFDRAFMKQMVSDHKATVALFEKEAKSGKNPRLVAFANETLPTLRDHLQAAEKVQKGLKGKTKK